MTSRSGSSTSPRKSGFRARHSLFCRGKAKRETSRFPSSSRGITSLPSEAQRLAKAACGRRMFRGSRSQCGRGSGGNSVRAHALYLCEREAVLHDSPME